MINRKEFIIKILRGIALISITLVSGLLIFREKSEEECNFDFACKNCSKLNDCSLNQAINYKKKPE